MKTWLPLFALVLLSCSPTANRESDIGVDDAWARATVPGRTATVAYLTISNRGTADDSLIGVTSNTGSAAIHSTSMAGGIMRMRRLANLDLPTGASVRLEPGGTHLMLTDLREPLLPGSKIEFSLSFEKSPERRVAAEVRALPGETM